MGYCNFCGNREIKRSHYGENTSDDIHPAFITPIRQNAARIGKQYVKRKGRVPNNGEIGIQPNSGMLSRTQLNARRCSTTQESPGIRVTQRTGK